MHAESAYISSDVIMPLGDYILPCQHDTPVPKRPRRFPRLLDGDVNSFNEFGHFKNWIAVFKMT